MDQSPLGAPGQYQEQHPYPYGGMMQHSQAVDNMAQPPLGAPGQYQEHYPYPNESTGAFKPFIIPDVPPGYELQLHPPPGFMVVRCFAHPIYAPPTHPFSGPVFDSPIGNNNPNVLYSPANNFPQPPMHQPIQQPSVVEGGFNVPRFGPKTQVLGAMGNSNMAPSQENPQGGRVDGYVKIEPPVKRGRPRGSKSKPKTEEQRKVQEEQKRKREERKIARAVMAKKRAEELENGGDNLKDGQARKKRMTSEVQQQPLQQPAPRQPTSQQKASQQKPTVHLPTPESRSSVQQLTPEKPTSQHEAPQRQTSVDLPTPESQSSVQQLTPENPTSQHEAPQQQASGDLPTPKQSQSSIKHPTSKRPVNFVIVAQSQEELSFPDDRTIHSTTQVACIDLGKIESGRKLPVESIRIEKVYYAGDVISTTYNGIEVTADNGEGKVNTDDPRATLFPDGGPVLSNPDQLDRIVLVDWEQINLQRESIETQNKSMLNTVTFGDGRPFKATIAIDSLAKAEKLKRNLATWQWVKEILYDVSKYPPRGADEAAQYAENLANLRVRWRENPQELIKLRGTCDFSAAMTEKWDWKMYVPLLTQKAWKEIRREEKFRKLGSPNKKVADPADILFIQEILDEELARPNPSNQFGLALQSEAPVAKSGPRIVIGTLAELCYKGARFSDARNVVVEAFGQKLRASGLQEIDIKEAFGLS